MGEITIFGQNYDFWTEFRFLDKISIFWTKCNLLDEIYIFRFGPLPFSIFGRRNTWAKSHTVFYLKAKKINHWNRRLRKYLWEHRSWYFFSISGVSFEFSKMVKFSFSGNPNPKFHLTVYQVFVPVQITGENDIKLTHTYY